MANPDDAPGEETELGMEVVGRSGIQAKDLSVSVLGDFAVDFEGPVIQIEGFDQPS